MPVAFASADLEDLTVAWQRQIGGVESRTEATIQRLIRELASQVDRRIDALEDNIGRMQTAAAAATAARGHPARISVQRVSTETTEMSAKLDTIIAMLSDGAAAKTSIAPLAELLPTPSEADVDTPNAGADDGIGRLRSLLPSQWSGQRTKKGNFQRGIIAGVLIAAAILAWTLYRSVSRPRIDPMPPIESGRPYLDTPAAADVSPTKLERDGEGVSKPTPSQPVKTRKGGR